MPTRPPGRSTAAYVDYGARCLRRPSVVFDHQRWQIDLEAAIAGTDATNQCGTADADQSHHEPPTTKSFRVGAGSRIRASVGLLIGTHGRFLFSPYMRAAAELMLRKSTLPVAAIVDP
jgi:hypothetical protein